MKNIYSFYFEDVTAYNAAITNIMDHDLIISYLDAIKSMTYFLLGKKINLEEKFKPYLTKIDNVGKIGVMIRFLVRNGNTVEEGEDFEYYQRLKEVCQSFVKSVNKRFPDASFVVNKNLTPPELCRSILDQFEQFCLKYGGIDLMEGLFYAKFRLYDFSSPKNGDLSR